jgi:hypothetical protein
VWHSATLAPGAAIQVSARARGGHVVLRVVLPTEVVERGSASLVCLLRLLEPLPCLHAHADSRTRSQRVQGRGQTDGTNRESRPVTHAQSRAHAQAHDCTGANAQDGGREGARERPPIGAQCPRDSRRTGRTPRVSRDGSPDIIYMHKHQ